MKVYLLIGSFIVLPCTVLCYTVDKVLALVYTTEETSLILQSDLRPGLDGAPKTLEGAVLERLMLADAKRMKVTVSEGEIDRYLAKVEEQHKLTREQTKELFKSMGYSYEEARNQLRNMQMAEQIKDHKVRNKAYVGTEEIEKYYKEHPVYEEAGYTITQGFVPFKGSSRTIKKALIEQALEAGTIDTMTQWSPPVTLQDSDFAPEKAYIKELKPGSVTQVQETDEGISLIQLVSKRPRRLIPLEERTKEISAILGKSKYEGAFEDYKKNLFASARIKYTDTSKGSAPAA